MPRSRYRVRQESCPHFLTVTVNHWLPLFTRPETVNIVLDSWRFLQREAGLVIYGYVILENHLHLVAKSENLSGDVQRFKSFTAREIIAYLESRGSSRLLELLAPLQAFAQDRKPVSGLGGRQSPATHWIRDNDASEAGLYPPEPRQTRLCRPAGALAVLQRPQLCRAGRLDWGDAGLVMETWSGSFTDRVPKPELGNQESGKAFKDDLAGLRSFRVSRFRIVYRIRAGRLIEIIAVAPRDRIYDETYRLIARNT
jgi:REP element-mobilizing transposase RayT